MTDESGPKGDPVPASDGHRAVFLSYASEDTEAAARICDRLRAAGIEVWFDQNELRGGAAWDALIRRQIKTCALFVPILSGNSRARVEGYFRFEWKLAVDRSQMMAAERPFLMPVVVDGTSEVDARVPEKFHEVQWTWLSGGEPTPAFVAQVAHLLTLAQGAPTVGVTAATNPTPAGADATATHSTRRGHGTAATVPAAPPPASSPPERSIAVLPFLDLSQQKDQEYFSDGLAEELIGLLTRVPELRVPARTSCFYFKARQATIADIARALNVAHVLEGSVRKAGNTIRVAVQLIRADSGYQLWSQTYDRTLDDVFKVQDEIAGSVVHSLDALLSATLRSRTGSLSGEAYQLYLRGHFHWNRRSPEEFRKAIRFFQEAIAVDGNYAMAYTGLADCYSLLPIYDRTAKATDTMPQAKAAILRALALDDELAAAHASLGLILASFDFDWPAAEREYRRAIELSPNLPVAHQRCGELLVNTGRFEAGLAAGRHAVDLDPLSQVANLALGIQLNSARRFDEAIGQLNKTLTLAGDFADTHYFLFEAYANKGSYPEAVAAYARQLQLNGAPPAAVDALQGAFARQSWPGFLQHCLRTLEAEGQADADRIAAFAARAGDRERAFTYLEQSYTARSPRLTHLKVDARYDQLRGDARFSELLRRVGLAG